MTIYYNYYHSRRLIAQKRKLESMVHERTFQIETQSVQLQQQANELKEVNQTLEYRRDLIEGQKRELELKNTEILNQRDQLVELNKEVESINQMRMKFFTNISHEFRTPLTLIISPIESLITDSEIPARIRKSLNIIYKNANRLHILIDQLLAFRKIETGNINVQLAHQPIGIFVGDIFHAFDELASQQCIDYQFNDGSDSCQVWFDSEKLENILYNLISNAFKYTPVGGEITCGIDILSDQQQIIISVEDNGIGITDEEQEKIFDRFYRITSNGLGRGTGIGLALVKDMVDNLGGEITVKSEVDKGSCFVVKLPCQPECFPNKILFEMPQSPNFAEIDKKVEAVRDVLGGYQFTGIDTAMGTNSSQASILIVEDNMELSDFIANALLVDFQVLTAANGKEGYEVAKKHLPDLIISDVMMPKMNGIDMCSQLKDNLYTSHIPVILLSAKAMVENFVEGLNIGADDYISKPFSIDLLMAKIKNLIESRRKLKLLFFAGSEENIKNISSSFSSLDDQFLTKAYDSLEKNYTNPDFSVEAFSELMFVSRSLLYKKLKALVDLSPNDFITVYRLKLSIKLLRNGNQSINEIAYQIGFNDPKYFSRVFKKYYQKTPSEYLST